MPIDSYSHYKEFRHVTFFCPKKELFTLIEDEEQIPKLDDGELVENKNVFTCEDKCVIIEKEHKFED